MKCIRRAAPVVESLERRSLFAAVPSGFVDRTVATGLVAPTSAEVLPDGRVLVTEQSGTLRVVKNGRLLATPALRLNVRDEGERGLLSVVSDPNFKTNRFIYLYYTTPGSTPNNRVVRYTMAGDVVRQVSRKTLLNLEPLSATNHNGGGMHFGADGKLYVATGENAVPDNAQTLSNRLGKILRINRDGSIPRDNPFYDTATGANRAIWAYGLRNPFSFAVQPGTGRVLINDVGQSSYEEINEGVAGANYGWPETEGPTSDPAFVGPIHAYTHVGNNSSITAGVFYNPPKRNFPQQFVGNYFFADLTGGYIKRLRFGPGNKAIVAPFATKLGTMVDLDVAPDGSLYYLQIGEGRLGRIRYTAGAPKTA